MSRMMEFYTKDDEASAQIGADVYRRVSIPIDDFNAACDRYGFVMERTCKMEHVWGTNAVQCSECCSYVATWDMECDVGKINYCPTCGRRVVE